MNLADPVSSLDKLGPVYTKLLSRLSIYSINDLLEYFPRTYLDTRHISSISELTEKDKVYTIQATINEIKNIRLRQGKTLQKGIVSDESGTINVTWFNQKFLTNTLKEGDSVFLTGKLNPRSLIPELTSPKYEKNKNGNNLNLTRISPVYNATKGISQNLLRKHIYSLIQQIKTIEGLSDTLPLEIQKKYDLLDLHTALKDIHFPNTKHELINARKRLAFDELLKIQFKLINKRIQRLKATAPKIKQDSTLYKSLIKSLPFQPTPSQKKAIKDIQTDLASGKPMYRLVQGDVGSGKTIVAFAAAVEAIKSGFQVVLICPTTILANQHYSIAEKYLGKKISSILVTSKSKKNKQNKFADLIISTHAILFHKDLISPKLGLVIIDEEHKFGVAQRADLLNQISTPHYLSMTATPIPRSIALTLFGDLDVSVIEKPSFRIPQKTFIVPEMKRNSSIDWITNKIQSGGQVYWVCPLIDEDPELELSSITNTYKLLQKIFIKKGIKVAELHGKMKSEEKTKVIDNFLKNKIQILVSTTVIEVGIDIPNANIIVIENAEKFGLAQLHQLRGRVGRANQESWVFLFSNLKDLASKDRLSFFAKNLDGNKIAEYDLNSRGPGEVYGTIQSGIPQLKIARFSNNSLLLQTREAAEILINKNND